MINIAIKKINKSSPKTKMSSPCADFSSAYCCTLPGKRTVLSDNDRQTVCVCLEIYRRIDRFNQN